MDPYVITADADRANCSAEEVLPVGPRPVDDGPRPGAGDEDGAARAEGVRVTYFLSEESGVGVVPAHTGHTLQVADLALLLANARERWPDEVTARAADHEFSELYGIDLDAERQRFYPLLDPLTWPG